MHIFTCNICNSPCRAEVLEREDSSCLNCGSNVRFRWIVHTLSMELFGESLPLEDFPERKTIRGLGMSDSQIFAITLANRLDYRNTFYDREPRLDIMAPVADCIVKDPFDFVVASELFEHVPPPVDTAFHNLAQLVKPGGFVVFSSHWGIEGHTEEHFPGLHDWQLAKLRSGQVLVNRTVDGRLETFENLTFHGGVGSVLEMRVFSKSGLLASCAAAGFDEVSIAEDYPAFGIVWVEWSRGMILRKRR